MKIAILGNQARAMGNFWSVLIRQMRDKGHEVLCILPSPLPDEDPAWEAALLELGAEIIHYPLDRKGLNPLRDLSTLLALRSLFKAVKPDLLFAFTIKAVIYGALAAALAGHPPKNRRHVMITGLGYSFEGGGLVRNLLMQVARCMYRIAFMCVHTVFFQNNDDRALFEKLSILPHSVAVRMCKGTGVDLDRFALQTERPASPVFLFVGRLLEAKGLRELYQAARMVKQEFPEASFRILGPVERGVGSVSLEEVQVWQREGIIEYMGETRDVRPYLAEAGVVVLPSWREGTPCSLMEAMGTGRAVVAADAPGSREVVRDGVNGYLVPVKNPEALAAALKRFIVDPTLAERMGMAGRGLMEREFGAGIVADGILRDMGL